MKAPRISWLLTLSLCLFCFASASPAPSTSAGPSSVEDRVRKLLDEAAQQEESNPGRCITLSDQGLSLLKNGESPFLRAQLLETKAWAFTATGQFAPVLPLAKEAWQLAQRSTDVSFRCRFLNLLGLAWIRNNAVAPGLDKLQEAERLLMPLGESSLLAQNHNFQGIAYQQNGSDGPSLEHYMKALAYYRKKGHTSLVAQIQNNIGIIYFDLRDWKRSREILEEALTLSEQFGITDNICSCLTNLGNIHMELGEYTLAQARFSRCLALSRKTGNLWNEANMLNSLGEVLIRMGKPGEAEYLLRQSEKLSRKIQDEWGLALNFSNLALCMSQIGKRDEALTYSRKSTAMSNRLAIPELQVQVLLDQSRVLENFGLYSEAFSLYRKYSDVMRDRTTSSSSRVVSETRYRFDSELREKTLEILRREKSLQEATLSRNKARNHALLALLAGIAALVVAVVFQIHTRSRHMKRIGEKNQELEEARRRLEELAITDPLTGLLNRRGIEERIVRETARADGNQGPLGVLLADVDHFKKINDNFGHEAGDRVLAEIGKRAGDLLRGQDLLGRLGGEEFLWLLPATDLEGAIRAAERFRVSLTREPIESGGLSLTFTLTFGVAVYEAGDSFQDVLKLADDALYRGKGEGRNRVVSAQMRPTGS